LITYAISPAKKEVKLVPEYNIAVLAALDNLSIGATY